MSDQDGDEILIEDATSYPHSVKFGEATPEFRFIAWEFMMSHEGKYRALKQSEGCLHVFNEEELPV